MRLTYFLPAILVILIDKAEVVFLGHEDMKQLAHFPNFYHILKILKNLLMKDLKLLKAFNRVVTTVTSNLPR